MLVGDLIVDIFGALVSASVLRHWRLTDLVAFKVAIRAFEEYVVENVLIILLCLRRVVNL